MCDNRSVVAASIAQSRAARDTVVASLHIWALNEHGLKKVAGIIDQTKPHEGNGRLSFPEVTWARAEVDKLARGEPNAFSEKVSAEEVDAFVRDFGRLEAFFQAPMKNLAEIRRPPLLLGKTTYTDVFEIDNGMNLDRDLSTMLEAGYDVIGVRDAKRKKNYVALNHHGTLKNVSRGTEGVLKTPYFDPVKVIFAEDINNGFWEGICLIPRSVFQLISNIFSNGKNRVIHDGEQGGDAAIRDVAAAVAPATAVIPSQSGNSVPGLVLAAAIGLGAVNLSTLAATAPEAGKVLLVVATLGTIYNAIFGRYFRTQDPYFVLNFAGVQLAKKDQVE